MQKIKVVILLLVLSCNYSLSAKLKCVKAEQSCADGKKIRIIDGFEVSRHCWEYVDRYVCEAEDENTCETLRNEGCYEVSKVCAKKFENKCILAQKKFDCPKKVIVDQRTDCKHKIPCLDGNCADQEYEVNNEMQQAIANLSILKAIEKEDKSKDKFSVIFNGSHDFCKTSILSFKDCCGHEKGWGVKMKFNKCEKDPTELVRKREEGRCHAVGTYCSAKRPIVGCVTKKTNYCCYDSKIVRIIQEEARKQLNIGWGSAEHPNCQGITIEQLESLDFEKMDFRELYDDIIKSIKPYNKEDINTKMDSSSKYLKEAMKEGKFGPEIKLQENMNKDEIEEIKRYSRDLIREKFNFKDHTPKGGSYE